MIKGCYLVKGQHKFIVVVKSQSEYLAGQHFDRGRRLEYSIYRSVTPLLIKGICGHLKATHTLVDVRQASETSHSKSTLGNFQHQYLAEQLLVNVYSYCLMVKSVYCCCVRGSRLFSDLVTYLLQQPVATGSAWYKVTVNCCLLVNFTVMAFYSHSVTC